MNERLYCPRYYKRFSKGKNCGVYQIRNVINGKLYIGSSKHLGARRRQHFSDLKCQRHPNEYLQRAYNKYGKDNFIFEVIEFCPEQDRIAIEQYWVDKLNIFNNKGYNISEVVEIPKICTGSDNKKSKKTIHVNTGKIYDSARIGAQETGQSYSAVRYCCLNKGRMKSGDVWMFLKDYNELTEEEKGTLLERKEQAKKVICLESKEIFESISYAAKVLNLNKRNISSCCTGDRWSVNSLHFLFIEDYYKYSEQEIKLLMMKQDGRKSVIDITDGRIYKDIRECALQNNIDRKSVYNHCHGVNKSPRFIFYEDYIRMSKK